MLRFVLGFFAALVSGIGGAIVLTLATSALTTKPYAPGTPVPEPGLERVWHDNPAIVAAAVVGFIGGAGTIIWLFASAKPSSQDPEESGSETRSEV